MAAGERADAASLERMAAALAHRGPDDQGLHLDGNLGLAHRRLSILDLTAAGHQPLGNEDGTVWIAYNGQLYDFEPVRTWLEQRGHRFRSRTDTEVLVHLYEEKGEELLDAVDGMFAFAVWDARRRRLLLARDRLGIKPLYYLEHRGRLAFSSELAGLIDLGWLPRDIEPLALVHFLYQSSVPGTISFVRGYRHLPPAHLLVADATGVRLRRYWTPPSAPPDPLPATLADASAEFRARLARAVRSHLVADVPVGSFLSGGLDSSAVSLEAQRALNAPLHTFSVRFDGPPSHDEGPAAREVADALRTTHHELRLDAGALSTLPEVVRAAGEPFAVSSAIALYHLARFAREHVKVVLTGDGADETLAGYPWRHEPEDRPRPFLRGVAMAGARSLRGARGGGPGLPRQLASRLRRMGRADERYAEIVSAFTPEELERVLAPEIAGYARSAWEEHPLRRAYQEEQVTDEVNRRLRTDLRTTLVDEMLAKVDRMTMAWGLEARVPFLDRSLLEWTLTLPGRFKVRGGTGKLLVRRALAPVLPGTAARRKHGFDVPLGSWFRGPLRELLLDTLARSSLRSGGVLRPKAVEELVSAHLAGRGDHSRKLFTLLALELWLRERACDARSPTAAAAIAARS
jgi:asparagine synthase (glutamine-hydrolysing)